MATTTKKKQAIRIALDSCAIIAALQKKREPARHAQMVQIVEACERGDYEVVAPTIAIAEVLRCHPDTPLTQEEIDQINRFFDNDYWHFQPVDRFMAEKAQRMARQFNLKPMDAIHAACFIDSRAAVLFTFDGCAKRRGLLDVNGQEFEGRPLNIQHPKDFASGTIFEEYFKAAEGEP